MTAKVIRGQGVAHTPGAGGGGCLESSRFIVDGVGPHLTNQLGSTDSTYIIWDPTPDFDDIGGFPDDYFTPGSGGFFFAVAGDYLVTVSAEFGTETCATITTGVVMLGIETGTSSSETYVTSPVSPLINGAQLAASTVVRAATGGLAVDVKINVHTWGVEDGPTMIVKATITLTKLCAL